MLLPGLDDTGLLFEPFAAAAPAAFDPSVLAYPTTGPQTYEALGAWVAERLPTRPFILTAESFSGPLAIRLAAEQPDHLRALVLAASFVRAPTPFGVAESLARLAINMPGSAQVAALALMGAHGPRSQRRELARVIKQVPASTLAARIRAVSQADARAALRRASVPVLYLRATRDRIVGRRHARDVMKAASDGTGVDIEAPHLVLQSAPEACWQAIERLVAEASPLTR
ncbi:MAG: alpha/beta hydrolase [Bacteroidota bacterium]